MPHWTGYGFRWVYITHITLPLYVQPLQCFSFFSFWRQDRDRVLQLSEEICVNLVSMWTPKHLFQSKELKVKRECSKAMRERWAGVPKLDKSACLMIASAALPEDIPQSEICKEAEAPGMTSEVPSVDSAPKYARPRTTDGPSTSLINNKLIKAAWLQNHFVLAAQRTSENNCVGMRESQW